MRSLRFALLLVAGMVTLATMPAATRLRAQSRQTSVMALTNATVLTVTKGTLTPGTVIAKDGKVAAVGPNLAVPPDAGARLGSIERGKRANLLVTVGDLLDPKPKIKHVFVGGRLIAIPQ